MNPQNPLGQPQDPQQNPYQQPQQPMPGSGLPPQPAQNVPQQQFAQQPMQQAIPPQPGMPQQNPYAAQQPYQPLPPEKPSKTLAIIGPIVAALTGVLGGLVFGILNIMKGVKTKSMPYIISGILSLIIGVASTTIVYKLLIANSLPDLSEVSAQQVTVANDTITIDIPKAMEKDASQTDPIVYGVKPDPEKDVYSAQVALSTQQGSIGPEAVEFLRTDPGNAEVLASIKTSLVTSLDAVCDNIVLGDGKVVPIQGAIVGYKFTIKCSTTEDGTVEKFQGHITAFTGEQDEFTALVLVHEKLWEKYEKQLDALSGSIKLQEQ